MGLEDTIVGFVGGLFISLASVYAGMYLQRRKERKETLRKHIRNFYPILRELVDDFSYAISIKLRSESESDSFDELSGKISSKFESFVRVYSEFRNVGFEPELESVDKAMANELKGLYTSLKMEGLMSFKNKFDYYYLKVKVCKNLVEAYLRK